MPRVRCKSTRSGNDAVESNFRWCPSQKMRVFKGICEKKCEDRKCPIALKRLDKERKKKEKAAQKRRHKKLKKEMEKWDKDGQLLNSLLKPEDRKDGSNS